MRLRRVTEARTDLRALYTKSTYPNPCGSALLALESDDFPAYRVALKDPSTNRELWRSVDLKTTAGGESKIVTIGIRADLLKTQNYVAELTGVRSRGLPEFIGAYAFHAESQNKPRRPR